MLSDYGENLDRILSEPRWGGNEVISELPNNPGTLNLITKLGDMTDWDAGTMITNLYAIDEKAGNELRYLESLLDEHASSYGLDILYYRYFRKAAHRSESQSLGRILGHLQETSRID